MLGILFVLMVVIAGILDIFYNRDDQREAGDKWNKLIREEKKK